MQIKIRNSYWKSKKANKTRRYTTPVISLHVQLITGLFSHMCLRFIWLRLWKTFRFSGIFLTVKRHKGLMSFRSNTYSILFKNMYNRNLAGLVNKAILCFLCLEIRITWWKIIKGNNTSLREGKLTKKKSGQTLLIKRKKHLISVLKIPCTVCMKLRWMRNRLPALGLAHQWHERGHPEGWKWLKALENLTTTGIKHHFCCSDVEASGRHLEIMPVDRWVGY